MLTQQWTIIILALIGTILLSILVSKYVANTEEKEEEKERKRLQEEEQRQINYKASIEALKGKYGEITIELKQYNPQLSWDDTAKSVFVFEGAELVLIQNAPIHFKKIINFTLADDKQIISTTTGTATTGTATGSMAGRALVGGALFGVAGAAIGAATASQNTTINTTSQHDFKHDYIIYLSVDDIANPQRILTFGDDSEMANKAASIFNIIINRNKS